MRRRQRRIKCISSLSSSWIWTHKVASFPNSSTTRPCQEPRTTPHHARKAHSSPQPGRHRHRQLAARKWTHAGRHPPAAGRLVSQMTGHRAQRTLDTLQMMMILIWIKRFLIKLPLFVLKPTKSSAQYHPLFAALNTTTTTIWMYILSTEPSPPIFLLHRLFFLNYQAKPETRLFYTSTTSELYWVHENQFRFIYVNTTVIRFVSFTRKKSF